MDYTADLPSASSDSGLPTYMIYRDVRPGEPFDPTAPLHFLPPKDSDELFDALRFAFPHLSTHSERLRDATIKFLLEEQQSYTSPPPPVPTQPPSHTPPTSQTSTLSMPSNKLNIWNHATVGTKGKFKHSPASQSSSQPSSLLTTDMPPQEDMTGVFSISSVQPKQHQRRKMTEKEKADYRKRRMVKACDKCAKRKRKCNHNFLERMSSGAEGQANSDHRDQATSSPSSPNSIDSHNQAMMDTSQETSGMPTRTANEISDFDFSGTQSMEGVSALPDARGEDWDLQTGPDFPMNAIDPALRTSDFDTWTSELDFPGEYWSPQKQSMGDWMIDLPLDPSAPAILRMDEFLQFGELVPEQWQIPWSRYQSFDASAVDSAPHSWERLVLPEDNEWSMNRSSTSPSAQATTALRNKRYPLRLHGDPGCIDEGEILYETHSGGHCCSMTYYGHALQKPEKDPKIAADDASSDGKQFDVGEMIMDGQVASKEFNKHPETFNWVLGAWLKSVLTFASVLTLVVSSLREKKDTAALNGWPMSEISSRVKDTKAKDHLALRF